MRQTTELVNIAMLTGKMQTHPMKVYSVSHTGRVSDVTSQTTCHSGDEEALKVSTSAPFIIYSDDNHNYTGTRTFISRRALRHEPREYRRLFIDLRLAVSSSAKYFDRTDAHMSVLGAKQFVLSASSTKETLVSATIQMLGMT
jgi:hypothetical protein